MDDPNQQLLNEILNRAVETGELVSIIYHGGRQPGTIREIRAIKVTLTDVWAYDDTTKRDGTDQAKKFVLSKIEIPNNRGTKASEYNSNLLQVEDPRTIKEIFEPKIAQLQAMGWHVSLRDNGISLHTYHKNGKPRKSAVLVLSFDEFITESHLDDDDWESWVDEKRKSKRPFHVCSPTYQGTGFSKLSRALTVFEEELEKHKPAESAKKFGDANAQDG
jgi:hypothetical protein